MFNKVTVKFDRRDRDQVMALFYDRIKHLGKAVTTTNSRITFSGLVNPLLFAAAIGQQLGILDPRMLHAPIEVLVIRQYHTSALRSTET